MISLGELTDFRRRVIRDGCTGKRRYRTYAEAEIAIGQLLRNNASRPELGTLMPYRCGCSYWHLGHAKEVHDDERS